MIEVIRELVECHDSFLELGRWAGHNKLHGNEMDHIWCRIERKKLNVRKNRALTRARIIISELLLQS